MEYYKVIVEKRGVRRLFLCMMMSLFVLGFGNAKNVEGSTRHKGQFNNSKPLSCGDTITTYTVLSNDLDCSGYTDTAAALTLEAGARLNLNGKKIIGNDTINCIDIKGNAARVSNGTVMRCYHGIEVSSNRNRIMQVEALDNERIGITIAGDENLLIKCLVANSGREGIYIAEGNKGNKIDRSIVENNGREGINIEGGSSNKIFRSTVRSNRRQGISITQVNGDSEMGKSNKIYDSIVDNNGRHGINIEGNSNKIYRSTVRGSCRDGIEISGKDNLVLDNHVVDNGNQETCDSFGEGYNPSAYAGIDVTAGSEENEIKGNRACGNRGCVATDSNECVAHERDFWDENVDGDSQCGSFNRWEHNSIICINVAPECNAAPQ